LVSKHSVYTNLTGNRVFVYFAPKDLLWVSTRFSTLLEYPQ
jgi:hypothetical protein